jgi:hypothetical protein
VSCPQWRHRNTAASPEALPGVNQCRSADEQRRQVVITGARFRRTVATPLSGAILVRPRDGGASGAPPVVSGGSSGARRRVAPGTCSAAGPTCRAGRGRLRSARVTGSWSTRGSWQQLPQGEHHPGRARARAHQAVCPRHASRRTTDHCPLIRSGVHLSCHGRVPLVNSIHRIVTSHTARMGGSRPGCVDGLVPRHLARHAVRAAATSRSLPTRSCRESSAGSCVRCWRARSTVSIFLRHPPELSQMRR